tara:strand:- start:532 stop:852 length:321 start_codon:yes stop_codon:yes gene_type:complete
MANKNYQYCVAENWGKGFIEHSESTKITFSGHPGNVWQVPANNKFANLWINKVLGVPKTCAEAQAIVDAVITKAQSDWDADNVDGETAEQKDLRIGTRPVDITLEE